MEKGDYIYDPNTGVSFILKDFEMAGDGNTFCVPFVSFFEGRIVFGVESILITKGRIINNPEIIDELDKALFKEGYYFDTDNLELVGPRWMPKDEHYCVPYLSQIDYPVIMDYENGVCCKTEAEAAKLEEVALDAIRKYLTNKK